MADLPSWVTKHKAPGVAVERRGDSFYASRVRSVWDAKKGRARKVTIEYLGRITQEGIQPPKHKRQPHAEGILEAGNLALLSRFAKVLEEPLRQYWPESWQSILAAGVLKLAYREPLKRLQVRYESSLACKAWPEAHLSRNALTELVERLGRQWDLQRSFFELLAKDEGHVAIDLTQVFSQSENIAWLEKGYNAKGMNLDQLALLLMWGVDSHRPGLLRLLPGAASSAKSLVTTVLESRLKHVVLMGDKAFFSRANVQFLEDSEVHYALALRRDVAFIEHVAQSRYTKYFLYRKRPQWYREYAWEKRRVVHYLDKVMAGEEEAAFLERVEAGLATREEFEATKNRFGNLAIVTDTGLSAKELYELYKNRREIEEAFDALKNTLQGDKTWMQSRESLQGYLFLLFVALHVYSQVLDHMRRKDMLGEYSVYDVLTHLSKIYVLNVNGRHTIAEYSKQTKRVLDRLEIPITENL